MAEKIKAISYPVVNQAGEKVSTVKLAGEIFGVEPHKDALFNAVNVYLSNRRQDTAKTKDRSEVRGGGKKPWRQKGTGRARTGSNRSPIWVGGGTVFGPTGNQNHTISMNKKEHALALRSALSLKVAEKKFIVIDEEINIEAKTKAAIKLFKDLKAEGKIMLIVDDNDELLLAVRNLGNVLPVRPNNVSVYDLLHVDYIVVEKATLKLFEGGLE